MSKKPRKCQWCGHLYHGFTVKGAEGGVCGKCGCNGWI